MAALLLAAATLDVGTGSASSSGDEQLPPPPKASRDGLASGELREASRNRHSRSADNTTSTGKARIEVLHDLSDKKAKKLVRKHGGKVTGSVPGHIVQAEVSWGALEALEAEEGINYLRPPVRIDVAPTKKKKPPTIKGEHVEKMKAKRWHRAGYKGKGVKVAIIDIFSGDVYSAAQAAREVPAPAGTFCMQFGATCNVFGVYGAGQRHGTAVAEVVKDIAPKAKLYLASAYTASDLQAAVNYFASKKVKIITRSLATPYDGPGNGTGPIANVVNSAAAKGMTWFNSAGNSAGSGSFPNSPAYYRAQYRNVDGDIWHDTNFSGTDETFEVPCNFYSLGLRWNDFNENGKTDFDLHAYYKDSGGTLHWYASSENNQATGGAPPIENFSGDGLGCHGSSADGLVYLAIELVSAGFGASNDVLEFQNNGLPMTYASNSYSAAVPVCDSSNRAQVCVGAIDPALGTIIASYSSRGPTNDARIKPDISAAACMKSFTYAPSCFNGTSAATPAAAGAAALVLSAKKMNPQKLGDYMRKKTKDRGATGPDNTYGTGEFVLPRPPR